MAYLVRHLAPGDSRALIRAKVQESVEARDRIEPITIEGEVEITITRPEPWPAQLKEGAERVDPFTVRYRGPTFWSVFHHIFYNQPDYALPG